MTAFSNPNYAAGYNPNYEASPLGGGQGWAAPSGAEFPTLGRVAAPQPALWGGGFGLPQGGVVAGLMALANLRNQMLEGQPRALLLMSCRAGRAAGPRLTFRPGPPAAVH